MPVRTVEFVIHNLSSRDLRLLGSEHYWGEWRPTGPPPSVIPPGGEGSIRSESSGPTSGTQGWVKYNFTPGFVLAGNEIPLAPYTISIAWDNPFFSGLCGDRTSFGIGLSASPDVSLSKGNLTPDQVPQRAGVGQKVRYFRFVEGLRSQDADSEAADPWPELIVAGGLTFFLGGYPGEVLAAIGFLGITAHPVVHLSFGEFDFPNSVPQKPLPQFVPMEQTSLGPRAVVEPDFWGRSWHATGPDGKKLNVDVSRQDDGRFNVVVDERVLPTPYRHVFPDIDPGVSFSLTYAGDVWSPVRTQAGSIALPRPPTRGQQAIFHPNATQHQLAGARQALARGEAVTVPGTGSVMQRRSVDRLELPGHGFLEAFSEFSNGTPVSRRARYVRYSSVHAPVCDVMMSSMIIK